MTPAYPTLRSSDLAEEGATETVGPIRLRIRDVNAVVAPRRLRPQQTIERVMYQVGGLAEDAARSTGGSTGLFYLDVWHERRYAQSVGYRFELTERSEEHTSELQSLMRISYA